MTEFNRTDAAVSLLTEIEAYCFRTNTPETSIGHFLFRRPGFVGLLRLRLTVTEEKEAAVREFIAKHPHGYAGNLPKARVPYVAQRKRSLEIASERREAREQKESRPRVDRDPCPRCGTRGDVGCSHSRVRLGMML